MKIFKFIKERVQKPRYIGTLYNKIKHHQHKTKLNLYIKIINYYYSYNLFLVDLSFVLK